MTACGSLTTDISAQAVEHVALAQANPKGLPFPTLCRERAQVLWEGRGSSCSLWRKGTLSRLGPRVSRRVGSGCILPFLMPYQTWCILEPQPGPSWASSGLKRPQEDLAEAPEFLAHLFAIQKAICNKRNENSHPLLPYSYFIES